MSWQANPDVISQRLGESIVLVHLATDRILELNQTAAVLFEMVTAGLDEEAMAARLADEYEVDSQAVRHEISALLKSLAEEKMVMANGD